jgi:pSer/pThr/pTyr-binding forkhead associated (FHA) protein
MPKITLQFKDNIIADYHLPLGCSLKIGRQKDNDVIIDNLAVSGYHGKIDSAGDGFIYVDLKSKNGSFINDERVSSHWLENGDIINVGKHSLTFAYFESESLPADKQASEMENTMIIDTNELRSMAVKNDSESKAAAPPEPEPESTPIAAPVNNKQKKKVRRGYLTYLVGGEGTLALKQKVIKIGKDAASDILVPGWNIGKTAATISRTRDGYFFSYVSGLAKPKINDKKASKKPQKLSELDIISIGSTKLQFIGKKQTSR